MHKRKGRRLFNKRKEDKEKCDVFLGSNAGEKSQLGEIYYQPEHSDTQFDSESNIEPSNISDESLDDVSVSYFSVNGKPIVLMFDVPHLLKNTRNAMLRCNIAFDDDKIAKFEYIQQVFEHDQRKSFKTLKNLEPSFFNFKDTYIKMKVKIAAAQLSSSIASEISTYVAHGILPAEAIFTAEFVKLIDTLFDSLNVSTIKPDNIYKEFRCSVSKHTSHLQFWKKMLENISKWRLIDKEKNVDVTNQYQFIKGWQITIRSMIYFWTNLQKTGFTHLQPRNFNQDPIENLFCLVRQHSTNNKPSCQHFTGILKTIIISNFSVVESRGNC